MRTEETHSLAGWLRHEGGSGFDPSIGSVLVPKPKVLLIFTVRMG
jgi:hypothetical protein